MTLVSYLGALEACADRRRWMPGSSSSVRIVLAQLCDSVFVAWAALSVWFEL